MSIVYLNGEFLPKDKAAVSVMDRGFLFGDGVYEVIPVYSRRPFRVAEHLRRLQGSLDGIRLQMSYTCEQWLALIERIVELAAPDKCTGCRLCEWLCPDFAIRVHLDRVTADAAMGAPR